MFSMILSFHLFAVDLDFNHLDIPKPDAFVKDYIVDKIDDDFVIFLSGLAGVTALRSFLRF
jgi:hypothetical protein